MVVLGGADNMVWNLIISKDGSTANDSAYHEYFMVIQAPQGETVHLEDIHLGATFRNHNPIWFDGWDSVSVTLGDVIWTPPLEVECYAGDTPPDGICEGEGVCAFAVAVCAKGEWMCSMPETVEDVEYTCDGLDNDCDGQIDEGIYQECSTICEKGLSYCVMGSWQECDAEQPVQEICDNIDNDCDGLIDNSEDCYPSIPDVWYDEEDDNEWVDSKNIDPIGVEILPNEVKEDKPQVVEVTESPAPEIEDTEPEPEEVTVIEIGTNEGGCSSKQPTGSIPFFLLVLSFAVLFKQRSSLYQK
jgi:hypothetical protein